MQRDPRDTITDIDTAIRKCLAKGMTNLTVELSPQDYADLLAVKAAHLNQSGSIDAVGPITTYRGYPVRTDPMTASQVLHKFENGRLLGYAVARPYNGREWVTVPVLTEEEARARYGR